MLPLPQVLSVFELVGDDALEQHGVASALAIGSWHETEVIDEDQGRSATSTHGRTGFQRMVAEVCLGRVGAVAAIEVSRFAGCSASPCDTPRRAAAPSAWGPSRNRQRPQRLDTTGAILVQPVIDYSVGESHHPHHRGGGSPGFNPLYCLYANVFECLVVKRATIAFPHTLHYIVSGSLFPA